MTHNPRQDVTPDSFTGAIIAVEGIVDGAVLLNGPTGCKFYHGAIAENLLPRADTMDPLQYAEEFYFGQPRVPATYLDRDDYIFGSSEKLDKILPGVAAKGHRLIAVLNSPGAALIGDDLERFITAASLPVPCLAIEHTGFSGGFAQGFQATVLRLLERVAAPVPQKRRVVNLIGLSIMHRHWQGSVDTLRELLALCGITVNTVLCAGCRVSELETIARAEANLVLHPEWADQLSRYLEHRFGQPTLAANVGTPLGFLATEQWLCQACAALAVDPAPALERIRAGRRQAHRALSRYNSLTGLPRGASFAIRADASLTLALTRWLYEYLGMVPVAVETEESLPEQEAQLRDFLDSIGCGEAWKAKRGQRIPDLVFGGEGYICEYRALGQPVSGIDIALPARGTVEILPRSLLGHTGALWLLERILNGLMVKD